MGGTNRSPRNPAARVMSAQRCVSTSQRALSPRSLGHAGSVPAASAHTERTPRTSKQAQCKRQGSGRHEEYLMPYSCCNTAAWSLVHAAAVLPAWAPTPSPSALTLQCHRRPARWPPDRSPSCSSAGLLHCCCTSSREPTSRQRGTGTRQAAPPPRPSRGTGLCALWTPPQSPACTTRKAPRRTRAVLEPARRPHVSGCPGRTAVVARDATRCAAPPWCHP